MHEVRYKNTTAESAVALALEGSMRKSIEYQETGYSRSTPHEHDPVPIRDRDWRGMTE